ncbi:MAG: hypothetical protein R3Y49_07715 [Rikenellaceae bacterium]
MKFIPYLKYVLLLLGVFAFGYGLSSYDSANPREVTAGLDFLLNLSAILVVITVVAAIAMPLISILQNPKKALTSLLGLVVLCAVFFVAYSMSSDEPIVLASGSVMDNVAALKFADTSLYAMYIAFAGVILSIVGTEIYKIFK